MNCKEYKTKTGKPIRLWYGDCMDLMERKPENYWDLAIVDPPYGNIAVFNNCQPLERTNKRPQKYKQKKWDDNKPTKQYWSNLFLVSNNQLVFGGNYFTDFLYESRGWFYWDKNNGDNNFSDGELVWTSYNKRLMSFKLSSKHGTRGGKDRFHPTQKPAKLYRWLLTNYAEESDTIIDTHGGSMSLAIACYIEDFELDIIELDEDYYNDAVERFEQHISQKTLF